MKTLSDDPINPIVFSPEDYTRGLTKREYFAAMAMQGLLVNYASNEQYGDHPNFPMVEEIAVRCADQLIEELNK